MKILKSILNYIPLATFIIFVVTDGIISLTSALIFVMHDDLTSSPSSSGLSPAVSIECPSKMLATIDEGCARCGT